MPADGPIRLCDPSTPELELNAGPILRSDAPADVLFAMIELSIKANE